MKKFLSILLALAIVLSCVSMVTFSTTAAEPEFKAAKYTELDLTSRSTYICGWQHNRLWQAAEITDDLDGTFSFKYRVYNVGTEAMKAQLLFSTVGYTPTNVPTAKSPDTSAMPNASTAEETIQPGEYVDLEISITANNGWTTFITGGKSYSLPLNYVTIRLNVALISGNNAARCFVIENKGCDGDDYFVDQFETNTRWEKTAATEADLPSAPTPEATVEPTPEATPVATPIATPIPTPNPLEQFFTYTVSYNEATITDFDSSFEGDLVIPSTLGGYPVTRIGYYAFGGCSSLTSITIPNSVTYIGDSAFSGCSSLNAVYITDLAAWCKISFGYGSEYANPLYYAKNLYLNGELVKKLVIPDSVTSIGYYAFSGCSSLTSITIPDSVTSIGDFAFYNCSGLTGVTIPDSVTSIEIGTFYGCSSLTSITIPDSVTSIENSAFEGCSSLTGVTIPEGVTSINYGTFYGCSSLTSITIPNSVTSIDNYYLFANCDSLISISVKNDNPKYYSEGNCIIEKETGKMILGCNNSVIPEGVKILGYNAFCVITNFQHLTIPASLVEIEDRAITFCNLQSITVAEGNPVYYSEGNCLIRKEDNCLILGCNNSVIPDGVTGIYYEAFWGCDQLASINIPSSITWIGELAFDSCDALEEVHITDIAAWCQLDIDIFDGDYCGPLRYAGNLYLNGKKVENLVIPDGVTKIGSGVFAGCSSITSVTIPNSVTEISYAAFDECNNLIKVYYQDAETQWNNINIGENNEALINAEKSFMAFIKGATLELGETLTINYFAQVNVEIDIKMRFTTENGMITIVNGVLDEATGYYKFAYTGINPQCMNDNIKAEILYGETILDILEKYSVKTYCENQITKTAQELGLNNSQYITFKRLIADLLTYGAAAQEYMQYNIDNYVDSSLWVSEHKSAFVVPDGVKKISGNTDENNRVKSVSLNISNVNKIYFRLVLTDENIKVLLNGTEIDKERLISQEDGTYLFYTDGLKATEFDKVFILTLVDGENNEISRVEYNVLAYIEAKHNSATVGNITKALNNYGSSAKKYFKSLTQDNGDIDFEDEDEI